MWNVQPSEQPHNVPAERKCTNISSLFVCAGFVVLMLLLAGYSALYGDMNRLVKGYDDCGNICGMKNPETEFTVCGVPDKTSFPKVKVDSKIIGNFTVSHYTCVNRCTSSYIEIFNRCHKKDPKDNSTEITDPGSFFQEISQDLITTWPQIALAILVAFVFSYIMLILFRYAIEYIIWIIYGSFVVLMGIGAIFFWVMMAMNKGEEKTGFLVAAIIFTVFTLLSILLLYLFRRRIKLVAELFKEASRALIDVPTILFEPILTFVALLGSIIPFVYFIIIIQTAGKLTGGKAADGVFQATYEHNAGMNIAAVLNVIAFIWFTQFIFGCQHFVIGGTISKWYFARDKTKLNSPVITTFQHLLSFHLGSVCLGSMLITMVKIIRMIINAIEQQFRESGSGFGQCVACCCSWLIEQLEELLKYLVRNAYIIVAKDGTPLVESGKRAFNLLFRNLIDVIALNNFGDFVLVVARLFVTAISGFIAYELMKNSNTTSIIFPVFLSIVFAFLISHCFVSVFEMTVDTIFICFCEDFEENDGASRPYYMSEGLRNIMIELKAESGGDFNFGNLTGGGGPEAGLMHQNEPPYPKN